MHLEDPRKQLIIDENMVIEAERKKPVERSNWLKLLEEREAQERAMAEEEARMLNDIEHEKIRSETIANKINKITAKQDLEYQLMKMDVPLILKELPDNVEGFHNLKSTRDLQLKLNKLHKDLVEGDKDKMRAEKKREQFRSP